MIIDAYLTKANIIFWYDANYDKRFVYQDNFYDANMLINYFLTINTCITIRFVS